MRPRCRDCGRPVFELVYHDPSGSLEGRSVFACAHCDWVGQWPVARENSALMGDVRAVMASEPRLRPTP